MMIVVTVIHVLACIILVLVVLLQAGKGADIGAVFGGASTTIFGSSGAGNFLTRLTTGAAIVFMATSLTLTYGSSRSTSSTLMPESVAPAALPEEPVAGEPVAGEPVAGAAGTEAAGTEGAGAGAAGTEGAGAQGAGPEGAGVPAPPKVPVAP